MRQRICPHCQTKSPKGGPDRWKDCPCCGMSVLDQCFGGALEGLAESLEPGEDLSDPVPKKPEDFGSN